MKQHRNKIFVQANITTESKELLVKLCEKLKMKHSTFLEELLKEKFTEVFSLETSDDSFENTFNFWLDEK